MTIAPTFAALAAFPRWVNYELLPHPERPGKTIKRPTSARTGLFCAVTDSTSWSDYTTAAARSDKTGFVFCEGDGFFFLDIDACLVNGQWSPLAIELCALFAGAAVEVSQSGTGLHIIGRGTCPEHSSRNIMAGLELYTDQRFVALTQAQASGDAGSDHSAALANLVTRYFPPNPHGTVAGWSDAPVEGYGLDVTDEELIRIACASGLKGEAARFGSGVTFVDLWTANEEKLAVKYPPSSHGVYDASMADGALAAHLGYWTGKDNERTRRLMLESALHRGKWDDRPDYLETTILLAAAVITNIAQGRPPIEAPTSAPTTLDITMRTAGREFLPVADQLTFFAGCVYVINENKIWVPGTGDLLDKARFDVVFSGHVMALDSQNDKATDSAWDCFTKSKVFAGPRVDRTAFRPEYPSGGLIAEDGRSLVNSYVAVQTVRRAGDPAKFLTHLGKLFPVARDQAILLHYMASCIRNPGFKAQWWPVIQGTEGNGKSFLNRLMQFCIGSRYSHLVNPAAMEKTGNQFNDWIVGVLYVGIEEIYVKGRRDFLDSFKTTVTDDRIGTEGKGAKQATSDNRANGLCFTNHPNAIPVTVDTRRYAIFYTAQQSYADCLRDGMGGNYFPDLYDWFYGRGEYSYGGAMYGASIINDYLREYELTAELDPAQLCVRAPATSSTDAAYRQALGHVEQEVIEAIEQGRAGFQGGWISSSALDALLAEMRVTMNRNKRGELLEGLGYIRHPGLDGGRVVSDVKPDNGKPRLYVTPGHLSINLETPTAIGKAYSAAQEKAAMSEFAHAFGK